MPPVRPSRPSCTPGLHWLTTDDGSSTLLDTLLNECYHSGCGAVAESLVVYVKNSGTLQQLASGNPMRIFEVGLGTGSALLLTAALAEHFQTDLDYWAIEKRLLPHELIAELKLTQHLQPALSQNRFFASSEQVLELSAFDSLSNLEIHWAEIVRKIDRESMRACTPALNHSGQAESNLGSSQEMVSPYGHYREQLSSKVTLNLLLGDILLPETIQPARQLAGSFDAIYFDPFSPATVPHLWQLPIFDLMFGLLRPGGTLTTYCVKSSVRSLMQSVGFELQRISGPVGGKREVLLATKVVAGC